MNETDNSRLRRHHPLRQLVASQLRQFLREPAAIFWVYGFPLIMMAALGIAFRNRSVEEFGIAVQHAENAEKLVTTLQADERFDVAVYDEAECQRRLRAGQVDLVIVPADSTDGNVQYQFDPTKPGSVVLRNAADDVLQRAAGRQDALGTTDR